MLKNCLWLKCTTYSALAGNIYWAVIFIYSLKAGGNVFYAPLGINRNAFVHLVNKTLSDDYFDYKVLSKDENSSHLRQKIVNAHI